MLEHLFCTHLSQEQLRFSWKQQYIILHIDCGYVESLPMEVCWTTGRFYNPNRVQSKVINSLKVYIEGDIGLP